MMGHRGCSHRHACLACAAPVGAKSPGSRLGAEDIAALNRSLFDDGRVPCHALCKKKEACVGGGVRGGCRRICEDKCDGEHGLGPDVGKSFAALIDRGELIIDVLHMVMRVTEKYVKELREKFVSMVESEAATADAFNEWLGKTAKLPLDKTKANSKLTGVQAEQVLDALEQLPSLVSFISTSKSAANKRGRDRVLNLVNSAKEFRNLSAYYAGRASNLHSDADLKTRAVAWEASFLTIAGADEDTLYIHYLAHHCPTIRAKAGPVGAAASCQWTERSIGDVKGFERSCSQRGDGGLGVIKASQRKAHRVAHSELDAIVHKHKKVRVFASEESKARQRGAGDIVARIAKMSKSPSTLG